MKRLLNFLFGHAPSPAHARAAAAVQVSTDLLKRMHDHSHSTDVARAIMADVWAQNHNIPYLTTVYETVQELNSGTAYAQEQQQQKRAAANDP